MSHVATVTIDNTKVSADLTDYVVYVNLADLPASFWDVVANGGGDIRVFKDDDTTELAREVVSCDTATDTGELHIKFSGTLSSSTDTDIHIYADGSSSEPAVTATYGRNNVWTGYEGVWHMQQDPRTGNQTDSTGNGYSLVPTGSMTSSDLVAGKLSGYGIDFDGVDDRMATSAGLSTILGNPTSWGFSYWQYSTKTTSSIALSNYNGGNDATYALYVETTNGDLYSEVRYSNASSVANPSTSINNEWAHVSVTSTKGAKHKLFLNGASPAESASNLSSNTYVDGEPLKIGYANYPNGSTYIGYYEGVLDEIRAHITDRTVEWNSTDYNNQNDTSTFYTATAAGGGPTGTNMQINIGDTWKSVDGMQINIGDTWKTVAGVQQNVGDVWKTVF